MANGIGKKIFSSTTIAALAVPASVMVMIFLPVIAVGAMVVGQLAAPRKKKTIID